MSQSEQLWSLLSGAGLVKGTPTTTQSDSPWFVKILLGFSGWLAALFLLATIGLVFNSVLRESATGFVLGSLLISGAYLLLRGSANEFLQQLALAVSLAGQALFAWALFESLHRYDVVGWSVLAVMQLALVLVMPHYIHRVFSAMVACFAVFYVMLSLGAVYLYSGLLLAAAAWLWLHEYARPAQLAWRNALGYGLIIALVPLKGSLLFGRHIGWYWIKHHAPLWSKPWMGELLIAAVLLYVIWNCLVRAQQSWRSTAGISALIVGILVSIVSFKAHGITTAVVILLLGFAGSNRVLLGLGVISLLSYISAYYYLLDTSLLNKSLYLLLVGAVLLLARRMMIWRWPAPRESAHG